MCTMAIGTEGSNTFCHNRKMSKGLLYECLENSLQTKDNVVFCAIGWHNLANYSKK